MAKVAFQRQKNVNDTRNEEVYDHIAENIQHGHHSLKCHEKMTFHLA
jgi:hypothetical protein